MRKLLSVILVLAIAACFTIPAFAAGSKTDAIEIVSAVDSNGNAAEIEVTETTIPLLTEEIANAVLNANGYATTVEQLTVLWQKDITSAVLPVTITFHVDGTAGLPLYAFHWNGAEWELVEVGEGEDLTVTFDELSPVGLVVGSLEGGEIVTAPQTGVSGAVYAAIGAAVMACAAAYVVSRKKTVA